MAADLNPKSPDILQVIQYTDDSLDAWFRDGSRMALSGCGAAFSHWGRAQGRLGAESERIHQYTQYAISEYRDKVASLVKFRNQFAEQPFICKAVGDTQLMQVSTPILYTSWPTRPHRASDKHLITEHNDGLQLISVEGHASIQVSPHLQTFTASYVVPIQDMTSSDQTNYWYGWTTELHSVVNVPDHWRHPVELLLQFRGSLLSQGLECESNKENEPEAAVVSTPLPSPLPLTCTHSHLHQLDIKEQACGSTGTHYNKPVKVLFSEGIFYRVFPTHHPPYVEAMPDATTLLRSRDSQGRFFTCWTSQSCRVQEHLYCADQPPPSSARDFSLARVMGQARRLLNSVRETTGTVSPCWKPQPSSAPPTHHKLSSAHIPGLGRFSAYSSGHVRVVFSDRTTLDLFKPALCNCGQKALSLGGVTLESGTCRLLLPNGRYQMISIAHPMQAGWYVRIALDWCQWVSSHEEERGTFYQGTVYDENAKRSVLAEIERIEHVLTGSPLHSSDEEHMEKCVEGALARTAKTLQDIDTLLSRNVKQN